MEHWWCGPGFPSGLGAARKLGSLSTATLKQKRRTWFPVCAKVWICYSFLYLQKCNGTFSQGWWSGAKRSCIFNTLPVKGNLNMTIINEKLNISYRWSWWQGRCNQIDQWLWWTLEIGKPVIKRTCDYREYRYRLHVKNIIIKQGLPSSPVAWASWRWRRA